MDVRRTHFIYRLHFPNDPKGRWYVGYTYAPEIRLSAEIHDAMSGRLGHRKLAPCIRKYGHPIQIILEEIYNSTWKEAGIIESFWIMGHGGHENARSLNCTAGGDGVQLDEEGKKRRSQKQKELFATSEWKEKQKFVLMEAYARSDIAARSKSLKIAFSKPEVKAKRSVSQKEAWIKRREKNKQRRIRLGLPVDI